MLKYILSSLLVLTVGYFEIQTVFAPVGTFLIFISICILWFYRIIIQRHFRAATHLGPLALWIVFFCITNVVIGVALNPIVADSARNIVGSVIAYKRLHGEFPASISAVRPEYDVLHLSKDRLKFGSRFYYLKDGDSFYFGFRSYPFGINVWNPKKNVFEKTMD